MNIANKAYALQMDAEDPLASFRDEFYLPPSSIYFDGNSLGLLSKRAETSALEILNSWQAYGIDGWTKGGHPWYYLSEYLGENLAPLVGAHPSADLVTGSRPAISLQLVASLYEPTAEKCTTVA